MTTDEKKKACLQAGVCVSNCVGYGRVCPVAAQKAGKAAHDAIDKLSLDSRVFPAEPCQSLSTVSKWSLDQVDIGKKLGQGGFSQVHEVRRKDTPQDLYAIKYLQRQVMVHPKAFALGASDLAVEAYFLASLEHDNIVKLHAMTAGPVEENLMSGQEACFFLVIDLLVDTLESRIEKWKLELNLKTPNTSGAGLWRRGAQPQQLQPLASRLQVASDICSAMQYIHDKNIVFRDLKPDNIGFDKNGVVKLFDFGLAKELRQADEVGQGKYKLTGKTGSRRYMAPEVALEECYTKSVDVYSFGILTWELCALEKPFMGYSANKHHKQVVLGHERPKMDPSKHWPMALQFLLQQSWSRHASQRPTFDAIQQELPNIRESCVSGEANHKMTLPERARGVSTPTTANMAPLKFANMKRPTKQGRAKTWGFPTRNKPTNAS